MYKDGFYCSMRTEVASLSNSHLDKRPIENVTEVGEKEKNSYVPAENFDLTEESYLLEDTSPNIPQLDGGYRLDSSANIPQYGGLVVYLQCEECKYRIGGSNADAHLQKHIKKKHKKKKPIGY